jgi:hypothetical protein
MIGQRRQRPLSGADPRQSLRSRQGLSPAQVEALLNAQGRLCALCRRQLGSRYVVDHDHRQAARHGHRPERGCPSCVRGLLCSDCNGWLRGWRDDPAFLLRAARYAARLR